VKAAKLKDGRFIILDTQRMRESPGTVENAVTNTASQDGTKCHICMEQEGGSGGKNTIATFTKLLAGYIFRGIAMSGKGALVERARPVSSQAEAGNILILRNANTEDFLNELEAFPNPKVHDDWVSALSIVMNQLFLEYGASDAMRELEERKAARSKRIEQQKTSYPF
jgi:predicted phage terminase large subunit-like protein